MVAASIYSKAVRTDKESPYTWFNYDLDTLYLDWHTTWFREPMFKPEVLVGEEARKVKCLALGTLPRDEQIYAAQKRLIKP